MGAVAIAASLLLAGCMVGPNYHRPDASLPGAFPEPDMGQGAIQVPQQWWTLYSDPTLDALVAEGLANNTDVQVATARVERITGAFHGAMPTTTPAGWRTPIASEPGTSDGMTSPTTALAGWRPSPTLGVTSSIPSRPVIGAPPSDTSVA